MVLTMALLIHFLAGINGNLLAGPNKRQSLDPQSPHYITPPQ